MSLALQGQVVSQRIFIGRAVVLSGRLEVQQYFIEPQHISTELDRITQAQQHVMAEIKRVQEHLQAERVREVPQELAALLDVHLMLLSDETLIDEIKTWIKEQHYNAEWALLAQLEVLSQQFDDMQDPYLRERKTDFDQVFERMLAALRGDISFLQSAQGAHLTEGLPAGLLSTQGEKETAQEPLVLIVRDLSPSDLLLFQQSIFSALVTEVGGQTSHTAIVARSMDIPAVVGARLCTQKIQPNDEIIIDGPQGQVWVNPSQEIKKQYLQQQSEIEKKRQQLDQWRDTPAITKDQQSIALYANIERPQDAAHAIKKGAQGIGLFRSEFLFMGRLAHDYPKEQEQYEAYQQAMAHIKEGPLTIRTIDIGADKPLQKTTSLYDDHLNPAMGLRAIRWSLAYPDIFLEQLRALLRVAHQGKVKILIPMLSHGQQIEQLFALIQKAKQQLQERNIPYGHPPIGAMIEVPAAALMVESFLKYFDFLSIGSNDLIQYTLAVDRVDEAVAHLYDAAHPAVLKLIAHIVQAANQAKKPVSLCGEMAGDPAWTPFLLGLGLKELSMHPSQILKVKEQVLQADTQALKAWAQQKSSASF